MIKLRKEQNIIFKNKSMGFTLVEMIIAIGMMSVLSGLILPSFLNWIRTEKVNAYTRELREYLRIVRLESRRWGSSCLININSIPNNGVPNDKNYYGFTVNCDENTTKINGLAPAINNSIFQSINKNFLITPNGRISSDKSIVIVIGSSYYNNGARLVNCLIIQSPTGHIIRGKFSNTDWITNTMPVSQIDQNQILSVNKCIKS